MVKDPAFVWQQPPRPVRPRTSTHERQQAKPRPDASLPGTRWVTLHEAEELTGIPSSTVRNWARKDRIASRFELTTEGQIRMVDIDEVVARGRELGRLRPSPVAAAVRAEAPTAPVTGRRPEAPEGSVLVPIDAWNRMIGQLGNLHEAGQQLAEARERAARAETEARFLRERLADLRREVEKAVRPVPSSAPTPLPATSIDEPEPAWAYLYRRWSARKRKR